MASADAHEALADHLFDWGLRPFLSDREYDQWQREHLRPADLHQLSLLAAARHADPTQGEADLAFYEYAAQAHIYPTLYSQRFDYYLTVGAAIMAALSASQSAAMADSMRILDVGCGLGILTTFYARQLPHAHIIGIDRSPSSIEIAQQHARTHRLTSCSFLCADMADIDLRARFSNTPFDIIIASHALLQSERDPGLPSASWRTVARAQDAAAQDAFEQRTGLGQRLAQLLPLLAPAGRLILCEKTHHLARRIPFQRALAARGLHLKNPARAIRYLSVEEMTDDGPLVVVGRETGGESAGESFAWDEEPVLPDDSTVYTLSGADAEQAWSRLPGKSVQHRRSFKPPGMVSGSIEWGQAGPLAYLYAMRHNGFRGLQVGCAEESGRLASDLSAHLANDAFDGPALVEALDRAFQHTSNKPPAGDTPLYENHQLAAEHLYRHFKQPTVLAACDRQQDDGRALHVEHGNLAGYSYLYCANTFDQRQLVMVEHARRALVETYYREITGAA